MRSVTLVVGFSGVGKSTVLEEAMSRSNEEFELFNFGDRMVEITQTVVAASEQRHVRVQADRDENDDPAGDRACREITPVVLEPWDPAAVDGAQLALVFVLKVRQVIGFVLERPITVVAVQYVQLAVSAVQFPLLLRRR